MATGIAKNITIIGVKNESTEGTYAAPAAATDYIQPLSDGFSLSPARDTVDRKILTSSIGKASPRAGMKSVQAALPVEFRASGTEGGDPDFDRLMTTALGARHQVSSHADVIAAGSTTTVIRLSDPHVAYFQVGNIIVIKEPGAHSSHAITAIDTTPGAATITILPAAPGVPSNGTDISLSTTYYPANSGHTPLSLSYYWANTIREAAIGCKVTSLSIDNFTVGQIASFNFGLEGLSFTEVDGAAPHTPSYDTGIPPLILQACVYQDGVDVPLNSFTLSLDNSLGFITSTCSADGKISSRITERSIKGTMNPYKDDTSVAQFTRFNTNTPFTLCAFAFNPSAVSGEITMGSVVGIYLPNCLITSKKVADQDGILTDEIEFSADRGNSGSNDEIFIGFV